MSYIKWQLGCHVLFILSICWLRYYVQIRDETNEIRRWPGWISLSLKLTFPHDAVVFGTMNSSVALCNTRWAMFLAQVKKKENGFVEQVETFNLKLESTASARFVVQVDLNLQSHWSKDRPWPTNQPKTCDTKRQMYKTHAAPGA